MDAVQLISHELQASGLNASEKGRLLYSRAQFYEQGKLFVDAIQDYSSVVTLPGPYKMRAILRLKTLCIEACQAGCHALLTKQQLGSEGFYESLRSMSESRRAALESQNLEDLRKLAMKCNKDPEIYISMISALIRQGRYSDVEQVVATARQVDVHPEKYESMAQLFGTLGQLQSFHGISDEKMQSIYNFINNNTAFKHDNVPGIDIDAAIDGQIAQIRALQGQVSAILGSDTVSLERLVSSYDLLREYLVDYVGLLDNLNDPNTLQTLKEKYLVGIANRGYAESLVGTHQATHYLVRASIQCLLLAQLEMPRVAALQEGGGDCEAELSELEYAAEATRRMLTRAKFQRLPGEALNADAYIDECNALFDRLLQLRVKSLQPDFYRILNVTADSSTMEIKRSYRRLARALHPDNYEADITEAEKRRRQRGFQRLAEAYDVLTNPAKREVFTAGQYNAAEINQRVSIHNNRKKNAHDIPPDYTASGEVSDEDMRRYLTDEQWYEYQKQRRAGR